jgi:hypothetical protein
MLLSNHLFHPGAAKSPVSAGSKSSKNAQSAKKSKKIEVPIVPQSGASPSGSAKSTGAREQAPRNFDVASYLEKLAYIVLCAQTRTFWNYHQNQN